MKIHEQFTDKNWCKNHFAVDKLNEQVDYADRAACKWCMEGWLLKVYAKATPAEMQAMCDKLLAHIPAPFKHIPQYNDDPKTTVEDAKAIFVKADL